MSGQVYSVSSLGGYGAVPQLTAEVRDQAQPLIRFRQFDDLIDGYGGSRKGDTFNWDIIANVATAGGTLVETSTIPRTNFTINQGTGSITEYGNAIPYTKKLKTLSQIEIDGATRRALRNDMVKVLDSAVHAQFDAAKIRYVGTATDGGAFTTNGTATATCTSQLNKYHVKAIVDYLQKNMLAPPYDGNSYMAIVTVAAHNGLYTDVEAVMQYTKYPANGEFGMYYNCRFVKETHILDNDMGNGSLYGQAFFFGEETVAEAVAEAEHIMFQPDYVDFQRNPALAWYFIGGFKIMHFANPDNRIVKYTSVEVN
jgi:N4-gp56 family major capsid protein